MHHDSDSSGGVVINADVCKFISSWKLICHVRPIKKGERQKEARDSFNEPLRLADRKSCLTLLFRTGLSSGRNYSIAPSGS